MMNIEATVAIIIAAFSLIGTVVTLIITARKNDLDILRGIIGELQNEVKQLKAREKNLKHWAERLVQQVIQLGGKPCEYEDKEESG